MASNPFYCIVKLRKIAFASLSLSFLLLLSLLVYPHILPNNSHATAGEESTTSLSISPSGTAALTLTPGVFGSTSEQTVSVSTTNYRGYTLTLTTSGTSTDLVNTSNSSLTISSLTTSKVASSFGSEYGYSTDGTNYNPAPSTSGSGDVLDTTSTSTAKTYGLSFGAKVAENVPAGTYQNTFTLSASANDTGYAITYNSNAASGVSNMPSPNPQEGTISGLTVTLSSRVPARTGFQFLGWDENSSATTATYSAGDTFTLDPETANSKTLYAIWGCGGICYYGNGDDGTGTMENQTASANSSQTLRASNFSRSGYGFAGWNTKADGTGTSYGPMATITMPSTGALPLYAVWVEAESGVTMQTFDPTASTYANASTGTVIALTDSRDNEVYAVAKLADGNWWMIENLRLDIATANITTSNTNHPGASLMLQKDSFSGDTWQTCTDSTIACMDQISYSLANTNRSNTASYNQNNAAGLTSSWYSYGGMYNWFTATAGNGLYSISSQSTVLAGDICPSGWHLPTGGTSTTTEYKSLNTAVNSGSTSVSTGLRAFPNNFVYSGYYYGSSAYSRGSDGYYWSSTASNNNNAYYLNFDSSYVYPGTNGSNKYYGRAVRCLAGNSLYRLVYDSNGGSGYADSQVLGTTAPDGTTTVMLAASNFERSGYGFAGWSLDPEADPNDANYVVYGPNSEFTVPVASNFDDNKDLTLYAIWVEAETGVTMQTFDQTASPYASSSTGNVIALTDSRDGDTYAVAKLADGNYWMIENLRLDPSDSSTTISTSNTNHPTSDFVDDVANNYKGNSSATLWKTCTTNDSACNDQISFELGGSSLIRSATSPNSNYQNYDWYSYGTMYNWYTATAGNGFYSQTSGRTAGDICPSGWHLPTGGTSTTTEYKSLNTAVNSGSTSVSTGLRAFPNNFVYSGRYSGSSANNRGSNGYYWSSTANGNNGAYYLYFYSSNVNPGTNINSKYSGQAVRCLANSQESFTLTYNANGGTGAPASQSGTSSDREYTFTLSLTEPTRTGLTFAGWSKDQNAAEADYAAGATYIATDTSSTLYAVWVPAVTIVFDASGGSGSMANQGIPSGTTKTLRSNTFTKSGYTFAGWATTEGSTTVEYTNAASYTAPTLTDNTTVTLYAVWGRSRTITYNINGGDAGTMPNQTGLTEYGKAELWAPNFQREGYGFAGWSENSSAQPGDGTSTIYGPNETITVPGYDSTSGMTLYAVWVEAESGVTMQTFDPTASTYANASTGTVIALTDSRDNEVYAVAKLADGNWWMIENLRLNPSDSDTTITSSNTNSPTSTFINTDLANLTTPYFKTCQANSSACDDQLSFGLGNITLTNTANRTTSSQSSAWYGYGVMYNWYTATAGNGFYSQTSGRTAGDICPSGWHLPTGGTSTTTEYKSLNTAVNSGSTSVSTGLRAFPNNFVYSGGYYGSSAGARGSYGYYWSSTANNNNYAYHLYFNSSVVNPGTSNYNKYGGQAVRCLAPASSAQSDSTSGAQSLEPSVVPTELETEDLEPVAEITNLAPVAGTQSLALAETTETVDAEDDTEETSSETENTEPLGVKRTVEVDASDNTEAEGSSSSITPYAYLAVAAVGLVATGTFFAIAGIKRDDDDENE